jgi:hypothetical protein
LVAVFVKPERALQHHLIRPAQPLAAYQHLQGLAAVPNNVFGFNSGERA